MNKEFEELKMDAPQICLVLSSIAIALMGSAKEKRAESLGGWDKAVRKQGMVDLSDEVIKEIQNVEDRFFHVTDDLIKICNKLQVKTLLNKRKVLTKYGEDATNHILAASGTIVDEIDRYVDALIHGVDPGLSYKDGLHEAIDMLEHLMFDKGMTRVSAIDTIRSRYKQENALEEMKQAANQ
jgi:hypothetical protein